MFFIHRWRDKSRKARNDLVTKLLAAEERIDSEKVKIFL